MAYFTVRNSQNPGKAVTFGITYRQLVDKNSQDGEAIWVLEVATDEPHVTTSGTIPPYFINLTSTDDVDEEIDKAVVALSSQIDWSPLSPDTRAPFVDSVAPSTYIAQIHENVQLNILDLHPSAGIDINSIEMTINDIDVTSDLLITGEEFDYDVEWRPPSRIYEQVDE